MGSSRNRWERDCSLGDRCPHRAALREATSYSNVCSKIWSSLTIFHNKITDCG